MSTYEMNIDGSSAEAGARRIVKSFDDIKAAANRMEGGVSEAARKASASFNAFANVKGPSAQVVSAIRELSSVMRGFKGPSQASVTNTLALLNGLKAVGTLRVGGAGVAGLLASMSSYKGPSGSSASNTAKLLAALSKFSGLGGSSRGVSALITTMNGFRGPSISAVRNTQGLLRAVESFKAPSGLASVARAFEALARSANSASASVGRLKSLASGTTTINVNASKAQGAIARLTHEHSLLHSAIFKTQTLYRSLGGIFAGKLIVDAANDILKVRAQLEAATGSVQQARVQFGFLREYAEKLGLEFVSLSRSYGFFLGSIKGTGVTFEESRRIFVGFSTAARALQLSTSDVDGVFRALGQIMSKGKLQAEELRGQLGDRLPGAFVRFARALDMTKPGELDAALKKGAVSGDLLKNAILEVAQTLEVEFADSADRMSNTVDAAFNRLRNSFTFSADALGRSGMNDAIISITDALRKFLESDAFNNAMKVLGGLFTILGNNIQLVASIALGVGVAAFAKYALTLASTATAVSFLTKAHMTLGLGSIAATGAIGKLTMALRVLWATMVANPIGALAVAIGAVTAAYFYFAEASDRARQALLAQNDTMGDAENFYEAYIAKVYDASAALDTEARSTIQLAEARLKANMFSKQDLGVTRRVAGSAFGIPITGVPGVGEERMFIDGKMISREVEKAIAPLVYKDKNGDVQLRYFDNERGAKEFARRAGDLAGLRDTVGESLSSADRNAIDLVLGGSSGRMNSARAAEILNPKALPFSMKAVLGEVSKDPDYNRESMGPGLSGELPEKSGSSRADSAAKSAENDLRRALEGFRDLRREIAASDAAIAALAGGATEAIEVEARAAAVSRIDSIEDSFENAHKGIMTLAQTLKTSGVIDLSTEIGSYEAARKAVEDYTYSLELNARQKATDANVSQNIADLRRENDLRADTIEAVAMGGQAMERANTLLEVENGLIGTSVENREALRLQLTDEIERRNELNRALEQANRIRELASGTAIENDMSGLYGKGYSQNELDYYRELYTERQRLINDGYVGERLREMMLLKQGQLDLAEVTRQAQEEEEKLRQLAADQADAIVGAFRKAGQEGQNFLKTMKNIFLDLKNILMDFVLYNPLKDFLQDVFRQAGPGNQKSAGIDTLSQFGGLTQAYALGESSRETFSRSTANNKMAPIQMANSPAVKILTQGVQSGIEAAEIVVQTDRLPGDTRADIEPQQKAAQDPFARLKSIYDFKANGEALRGLTKSLNPQAIKGALKAGGAAIAAFGMGQSVGKMLGLGRTGSNVLGGASAGFSVGGPVGAAIGATVALAASVLFRKKVPSAFSNVRVGQDGLAVAGPAQTYGKGDVRVAQAAGRAGSSLFNEFAQEYDASLVAGNYGTFGRRKFKVNGKKEEMAFYSLTGNVRKGKPKGREGVDWIKGTDSEVQAFALRSQLNRGMISGLSPTLATVGRNTKGTTMEEIQADFSVGRAYDEFIRASYQMSSTAKEVFDLNNAMEKLAKQSKALGLSETKLAQARDRIIAGMKKDFDFNVRQGILDIENPMLAAYNALEKEYRETVENGMAIGGDLIAVEKLYGLKRIELSKQLAEEQTNIYRDLLTSLTASGASPLNAETVLQNARGRFEGLRAELGSGNTANIGNLGEYVTNYLEAARSVNASSSGYFDIFNDVTSFLETMSGVTDATTGGGEELPGLPALDSIIAEITARNEEMLGVQQGIGTAILETGANELSALERLIQAVQGLNGQGGVGGRLSGNSSILLNQKLRIGLL